MSEFEDRKKLTFEQAEGAETIPSQLALKKLSDELRARLWAIIYESLTASSHHPSYGRRVITDPWRHVLYGIMSTATTCLPTNSVVAMIITPRVSKIFSLR